MNFKLEMVAWRQSMLTIEQETVLCRRFYVSGCKCIIVLQLYPTTTLQAEFAIYVSDSEDGKRKFLTVALENEETFVKKEAFFQRWVTTSLVLFYKILLH